MEKLRTEETSLTNGIPAPNPGAYNGITYYDMPAIKGSHYRWLITGYFYIGGIASASQFLATVMDLFGSQEDRHAVRAGRYLSLLGALLSPPLLILDLATPQRWYNMLRIFRQTSAMSIGSWALSGFGFFSGLTAAAQALSDFFGSRAGLWLARLTQIPASLMAGIVAVYTGTLLAATNVPFWASGYPVLSSLFASSAASTASAALTLLSPKKSEQTRAKLSCFGLISGLSELFFALRVQRHWRRQQVEYPLRTPLLGLTWRVGVLGLGILAPVVLHLLEILRGRSTAKTGNLSACVALAGGFFLRAVFIFGGKPSADHPQDYFRLTQVREKAARR